MLNEKNNKDFQKMEDNDLEQVVGGYLQVSRWRDYATTDLLPLIIVQQGSADNNDKAILDKVYSAIQSTMVPGASVVDPMDQLYADYYYVNRTNIRSDSVRQTLDTVLTRISNYLSANA